MGARTPATRARHAKAGLATRQRLEPTTQAMLLRQLYLALYEKRRFDEAHDIALQALSCEVLSDVLHQDAARAALANGDVDEALAHLRTAARRSPASRRPFHLWTLGSTLFLMQRYPEAISALERATRWGTHDKPLYRAHLALATLAAGVAVTDLQPTIDALANAPCGQGYGRFVLGHLAYAAREWDAARKYLEAFVRKAEASRATMTIALEPELHMARATLAKMSDN